MFPPELYKKLFRAVRKRLKTDSTLKKLMQEFTYGEEIEGDGDEGRVMFKLGAEKFCAMVEFNVIDRPKVFKGKERQFEVWASASEFYADEVSVIKKTNYKNYHRRNQESKVKTKICC